MGLLATTARSAPTRTPTSSSWGNSDHPEKAEPGRRTSVTTPTRPKMRIAVPANSLSHSAKCHPPVAGWGAGAGADALASFDDAPDRGVRPLARTIVAPIRAGWRISDVLLIGGIVMRVVVVGRLRELVDRHD